MSEAVFLRMMKPRILGAAPAPRFNAARLTCDKPRTRGDPGMSKHPPIPGTVIFDGAQAMKGYALNRMCYSFNEAASRQAFLADEDAYCAAYGLNPQQREAIRARNVLQLIDAGGNAYYLAKFAGIFGLDMQDIGAQQTGLTREQFQARLLAARG
jgi:protocatechuate 4,5-dioxygenase alpha chain